MKKALLKLLERLLLVSFLLTAPNSYAKNKEKELFSRGKTSLSMEIGTLSSDICNIGPDIPSLKYDQLNFKFSYMLTNPKKIFLFPKTNLEALVGASFSHVRESFGNYVIGPTVALRANFLVNEKFIPYIHMEGGIMYNDLYKNKEQEAIGEPWEFNFNAGIGFTTILNSDWSVYFGGIYNHLSNGGRSERNDGDNSFGAIFGIKKKFK